MANSLNKELAAVISSETSRMLHTGGDSLDVWTSYSEPSSPKVYVESATVRTEDGREYDVEFEVTVKVLNVEESDE